MANKNRNKGHQAEREYSNMFKDMGHEFCVTSRYGSRQHDDCGIDLINVPYNVQIKAGYARGLNYSKVLRDICDRVSLNFPRFAIIFLKSSRVITTNSSNSVLAFPLPTSFL